MIIRSNYRESEKEQFEMEVVGETINSNNEECYLVRLLPKYQNQFQEKDNITELRKKLVGDSKSDLVDNELNFQKKIKVKTISLFD